MLTSIYLYDQVTIRTTEINDVTSDRMLTAELEAIDLSAAQTHPELTLGVRLISSEVASTAAENK